jgi:hypothetical protein
MEAVYSSEKTAICYKTTQFHNLENRNLNSQRRDKCLKLQDPAILPNGSMNISGSRIFYFAEAISERSNGYLSILGMYN